MTDVTIAKQVLNEVSREVQSQGWHFNTEPKVKLVRNVDNEIAVPADTARIDSNEYNVVIREGKLFDLDERKFTFESNIEADIVYYRDFEELPDTAKKYITTRAARIYSDRMINSETMHRMLAKDEQSALIDLKEFEGDTGDYNMMDSYSVARVLNRGHKRILM